MRVRAGVTAFLVALIALTTAGCGDDDGSDYVFVPSATGAATGGTEGQAGVRLLKASELAKSLVSLNDVGPGFAVHVAPDSGATDMGCLTGLGELSRSNLAADASDQARYDAASQLTLPSVVTKIRSFSSIDRATEAFRQLRKATRGCASVSSTSDGFSVDLGVTTDAAKSGPAADAQFTMTAVGTGTTNGVGFPFGTQLSVIRVQNNVALVAFTGVGTDVATVGKQVAALALERLAAVTTGEVPNPTPLNLRVTTPADLVP